jgi:plasmid stabilization system protein ParE
MRVIYSAEAHNDFASIGLWIAADNPVRAEPFIEELHGACEALADMPRAFPLLPHRKESGIRRRPIASYLIFYRTNDDEVEILRVLHGARDYEQLLFPG